MQGEFDTVPSKEFPLYTRGWASEFMPDVVSPLTASLVIPLFGAAWNKNFTETLPVLDGPLSPWTFVGIFEGRLYINLSILRRAGDLSSTSNSSDMDFFFAPEAHLPPYERPSEEIGYEDRAKRLADVTLPAAVDPPINIVEEAFGRVTQLRMEGRASRAQTDPSELIQRIEQLTPVFIDSAALHLYITGIARTAFRRLNDELRNAYQEDDARRIIGTGLGQSLMTISGEPGRRILKARANQSEKELQAVLDEFGYRGPNEWELSSPSWEMLPSLLIDVGNRKMPNQPRVDPQSSGDVFAIEADIVERGGRLETLWSIVKSFLRLRELTRACTAVIANEFRLDSMQIGRMLEEQGLLISDEDVYFLSWDELSGALEGRPPESKTVSRRRQERALLRGLDVPLVLGLGDAQILAHKETSEDQYSKNCS